MSARPSRRVRRVRPARTLTPAYMPTLTPAPGESDAIVQALTRHFYEFVPGSLRTYCALTSRITQAALKAFGLPARLTACQIWYVTPRHNHVVGFLGREATPGKWDGHVACTVGPWLIDAALHQCHRDFGLAAPWIALARPFQVRSRVIARLDLAPEQSLWWLEPPGGLDATAPAEPEALVQTHAQALVEGLATRLRLASPGLGPTARGEPTLPRSARCAPAQNSSTVTAADPAAHQTQDQDCRFRPTE